MRSPLIDDAMCGNLSRYSLVIAVAKRAREISSEAETKGEILLEKPVNIAIEQFEEHKYKVIEPENEEE